MRRAGSRDRLSLVERIDWFRVLADLKHARVSNLETARRLGVAPATVWGWRMGSEPNYHDGEALIALWRQELDHAVTVSAPRTACPVWLDR